MPAAIDRHLIRGALVNLLGVLAKLVHPLFFIFVIRMFGTDIVGVYFVASFIVQVASTSVTAGYGQGTILFASSSDAAGEDLKTYAVIANAFVVTLGLSFAVALGGQLGSDWLVATFYSDRPELAPALRVLLWSVPLVAFSNVAISATQAKMRMEYEAVINGLCKPLSLLLFATIAFALDLGLLGLVWAHLASSLLLGMLAAFAFGRHYSAAHTMRAVGRFALQRELLVFALPQSLNMTFNRYATRLDVIMLAAFGHSNHAVAFYSAAALLTSSLREIKMAFGSALAPVAARLHTGGGRQELEAMLGRVSRWTTSLVAPLLLIILVLRNDVLALVDPSFVGDTTFMAWLLIPPFLSCAVGLAGNLIVYTRHSEWNLFNSVLVAALNTAFNAWLIPSMGLAGAAIATVAAAGLSSAVQLVELRMLERLTMPLRAVWKPHLGLFAMTALALLLWDPAALPSLWMRLGFALLLLFGFLAAMAVLRHPELAIFAARLQERWNRVRSA